MRVERHFSHAKECETICGIYATISPSSTSAWTVQGGFHPRRTDNYMEK